MALAGTQNACQKGQEMAGRVPRGTEGHSRLTLSSSSSVPAQARPSSQMWTPPMLPAPQARLPPASPMTPDGQWAAARGSWQPKHTCHCGQSGGRLSWVDAAPRTAVQRGPRALSGQTRASTATRSRASVKMTHPCPTSSHPSPTILARLGG